MRLHFSTLSWLFVLPALSPLNVGYGAGAEVVSQPQTALTNSADLSAVTARPAAVRTRKQLEKKPSPRMRTPPVGQAFQPDEELS